MPMSGWRILRPVSVQLLSTVDFNPELVNVAFQGKVCNVTIVVFEISQCSTAEQNNPLN